MVWSLVYDAYEPRGEGTREALCALGNGRFVTRGACPTASADKVHYPGTYLAGGYNRAVSRVKGRDIENEDLVNMPNWLPLTVRIGDRPWLHIDEMDLLSFHQELDLKAGLLARRLRFRDREGRITRLAERRFVSMRDPHLAGLEWALTPENWSGPATVRAMVDGAVVNAGVPRYRDLEDRHLELLAARAGEDGCALVHVRTRQAALEVAVGTRLGIDTDGPARGVHPVEEAAAAGHEVTLELAQDRPLRIEKIAAIRSSRDPAIADPVSEVRDALADAPGFDALLERHRTAWEHLWQRSDVRLSGELEAPQLKLRVHIFHLLQTASPHSIDSDAGVPARGWHGEAYRGHVFWDELFIFPFLDLRVPGLTRALLPSRYRRLDRARRAAASEGYAGAMFPWQSGSNGREETQKLHLNPQSGRWLPDTSHRQRHVGLAVAYTVWSYFEATGDRDFLADYGAEMLVEIARFWASLASYDAAADRYDIRGVMGPDEYHTAYPGADPETHGGIDNNAYSNVMAAWALMRAGDALDILHPDRRTALCARLAVTDEELEQWDALSRKLKVPFLDGGIIAQFEGYERLEELDWEAYRARYGDIQRLDRILEAEGDDPNRYKLSKQADVLMLFYLLSKEELAFLFERLCYPFDPAMIPRTIEYYLARTSHGSTLSWIAHAWVLARADRARSWHLFLQALDADLGDLQGGTTREGIHLGAMAGTVDLAQRCYTGLETRGNALRFNPVLPEEIAELRFTMRYRGQRLAIAITQTRLRVESLAAAAEPVSIAYREQAREMRPGDVHEFRLLLPEERRCPKLRPELSMEQQS